MDVVLIVGAHYDDAELGVGATAARLVSEGKTVYKLTLTNTNVISNSFNLNISQERAMENSKEACKILGIKELPFDTEPYGELKYHKRIMQNLENIIIKYKIDTVFFHFSNDYNSDHIAAHQICMTAARHCKNLLMYQSNPYILAEAFYPNVYFDVSSFIGFKQKALNCYDKEHNRQGKLFETNIERNKIWGYGIHTAYAEGFMAVKISL